MEHQDHVTTSTSVHRLASVAWHVEVYDSRHVALHTGPGPGRTQVVLHEADLPSLLAGVEAMAETIRDRIHDDGTLTVAALDVPADDVALLRALATHDGPFEARGYPPVASLTDLDGIDTFDDAVRAVIAALNAGRAVGLRLPPEAVGRALALDAAYTAAEVDGLPDGTPVTITPRECDCTPEIDGYHYEACVSRHETFEPDGAVVGWQLAGDLEPGTRIVLFGRIRTVRTVTAVPPLGSAGRRVFVSFEGFPPGAVVDRAESVPVHRRATRAETADAAQQAVLA